MRPRLSSADELAGWLGLAWRAQNADLWSSAPPPSGLAPVERMIDRLTGWAGQIASVHVHIGLIWSDILIESSGGTDTLTSHGHHKSDAFRIQTLIESYQSDMAKEPARGEQG